MFAALIGGGAMIAGIFGSSDTAEKIAAQQRAIAADEQKIEAQKQMAMELDARRKELEVFRNMQKAQALGLVNATNQGAGRSSGLAGGQAQARNEATQNLLGIGQNLTIGRDIFSLNADISQHKMQLADLNADAQFYSGLTSFGGSILGASGNIGKFFG